MFFIGQDTSSKQPSAIAQFSQHHINSGAFFSHEESSCRALNIQHKNTTVTTNKYITHTIWTLDATNRRVQMKWEWSQCMNQKVRWKNWLGSDWNSMPPHKLKTTWRRLLFGPCLLFGPYEKSLQNHATQHDGQSKRVRWYTFFFPARFAFFCACLARFRARFAQGPWIISGAKCQHHACQSRPNAKRHFSSSKRQPDRVSQSSRSNLVMHSHATGRLILQWGVSKHDPMHFFSPCTFFTHGSESPKTL